MSFSKTLYNTINKSVAKYLYQQSQTDVFGIPLYPHPLAYSLNTDEIRYAEDLLQKSNSDICFVKKNYGRDVSIYYYKHPYGNFTIGLNSNNEVSTIACDS
jgi:hypothetical protein